MVNSPLAFRVSEPEDCPDVGRIVRRRIDPRPGRALEIFGHAIEYLTDEYVHRGGQLSAHSADVEAIQVLMSINREIYLACPAVPTFRERLRRWLGQGESCV